MASTPGFMSAVGAESCVLTGADGGDRSAPNNSGVCYTATVGAGAAGGGMVERITVYPRATTSGTRMTFYIYDGANYRALFDVQLPAQTFAVGTPVAPLRLSGAGKNAKPEMFPIMIPSGSSLKVSMNDALAGGVVVTAEGGKA